MEIGMKIDLTKAQVLDIVNDWLYSAREDEVDTIVSEYIASTSTYDDRKKVFKKIYHEFEDVFE